MTTNELFAEIIKKRNWQKGTGISPQYANTYKERFKKGLLKEAAVSKMLEKLGYEKKVTWKKKKDI